MKKIVDKYNRELYINEEKKKLVTYSNKDKKVTWHVPIVEDGTETEFFTDYTEDGTIDDIALRLDKWNNSVRFAYLGYVKFNADKNDPDGTIWNKFVKTVKEYQDDIFDEYGDFKENLIISDDEFKTMLKRWE